MDNSKEAVLYDMEGYRKKIEEEMKKEFNFQMNEKCEEAYTKGLETCRTQMQGLLDTIKEKDRLIENLSAENRNLSFALKFISACL